MAKITGTLGLNPCSNGILKYFFVPAEGEDITITVLILVLMEY